MFGPVKRAPIPRSRKGRFLVLAAVVVIAYLPSLSGDYVYDDVRFVAENTAIRSLTPLRYFTDPSTVAEESWEGIYRPLRTLDFAIDWAIAGSSPWFFHLRNILYHLAGVILLWLLLSALLGEKGAAFYGALAFALHPVHTESVAWITSRADAMVLVAFLGALLLHVRGHRILAAIALVLALFAKEAAVVFPGAVLLVDLLRREKIRYAWYTVYGVLALGYTVFWFLFLGQGKISGVGHLDRFWGGSYGANLLTMSKGFLYYLNELLFPIGIVIDYHVPATRALDAGSAIGIVAVIAIGIAAWLAGPRARFAYAWFFLLLLPVSNLVRPIGIPTAERFLYLPSIGLIIWIAPLLARTRVAIGIVACFGVLTFARCIEWQTNEKLFGAALAVTETPRALSHRADRELRDAIAIHERLGKIVPARRAAARAEAERHAREVIRLADSLIILYETQIKLPPADQGGHILVKKANALNLLGEYDDALDTVDAALAMWAELPDAFYNAAYALKMQGKFAEAAANLERAKELGYEGGDLDPAIRELRRQARRPR